jgi:hypothetical protein
MKQSPWRDNSRSTRLEILPPFMEADGSLSCSQESATEPYPELDETSQELLPLRFISTLFPSTPRSLKWSRLFRFTDQNFVCTSRLFHSYYTLRHLVHLYVTTQTLHSECYKLWSSSLRNFLHHLVLFFCHRSKYSLQHPVHKSPQSVPLS